MSELSEMLARWEALENPATDVELIDFLLEHSPRLRALVEAADRDVRLTGCRHSDATPEPTVCTRCALQVAVTVLSGERPQ